MTYSESVQAKIDRLAKATQERDQLDDGFMTDHFFFLREDERLTAEITLGKRTGYGPEPGMPCTMTIGSDRYGMEVVWVSPSSHQIRVATTGTYGLVLGPDTVAKQTGRLFTRREDGTYREKGGRHCYLTFLKAEDYRDPSF